MSEINDEPVVISMEPSAGEKFLGAYACLSFGITSALPEGIPKYIAGVITTVAFGGLVHEMWLRTNAPIPPANSEKQES